MSREPRAVLLLLALAVAGQAGRLILGHRGEPPGAIVAPVPASDPARHAARAQRLARPLRPGETIDLNTASADEIARLPRIGMSLAKRIVQDRTTRGAFRDLAELDRVPGVGPALLDRLSEWVAFGGNPVASVTPGIAANPGISGAYAIPAGAPAEGLVDLNSASVADLEALPGIGKARARAILAYRRSHGSFAGLSDLGRVPGFGQSLIARLAPLVTVR
jgi:competence ComEA-like helix-hairpin-helix protein